MSSFIEKINKELTKKVIKVESIKMPTMEFSLKQYLDYLHTMDLKDIFFYPDLQCLIDYEKEFNGRN